MDPVSSHPRRADRPYSPVKISVLIGVLTAVVVAIVLLIVLRH